MSMISLLVIAIGATFSIVWLIHYLPLLSTKPKTVCLSKHPETNKIALVPRIVYLPWSPRLFACKLLVPFDIGITLFLVFAGMLGLTTMVTGISMMVFNVLTAIGVSAGVYIVHKFFMPRWTKQYESELREWENQKYKKA